MFLPTPKSQTGVKKRESWMPDPGVHMYVRDMLYYDFGIQVEALPEHWIPLTIVGTLDWIVLCQWWVLRNTGLFESKEQHQFVFEYDGYEFDPDQLLVFRDDPERNKFAERMESPRLTRRERTEALPFVTYDIFGSWLQGEQGLTEEEAEEFVPPSEFLEVCMWSTFMWVLDTYGRDWIYMQDELLACAIDYSVAYYSQWDDTLLDPNIMVCTQREVNTCRYCGEKLWCVRGTEVDKRWQFVCNNCIVVMALECHHHLDERDDRLLHPHCPHWRGVNGESGSCMSTCKHSGMNEERVWEKMAEHGSRRVDAYRDKIRELGMNPRQMAGQSVRDIINYFNGEIEASDRKRLREDP